MSGPNCIDTSGFQHPNGLPINWTEVHSAGVHAAIIKATEGTGFRSEWTAVDGRAALHAGVVQIGYYHFARPGEGPPQPQVENLLAHTKGLPRSIGYALDLEDTGGLSWQELAAWAQQFLDYLVGVEYRFLYVNRWFLTHLPGAPWGHLLWLAAPGAGRGEDGAKIVQFGVGNVPGVPAPVDLDVMAL